MSLATVRSCALAGVTALPVVVEVHLGGGLPGMAIVGLPESAVRESKDRVRAAIRHAGFRFPKVKVVVNLAPADLPKRGGRFDLPIALGILVASGQLPAVAGVVAIGELGLGGEVRAVGGALPAAQACRDGEESLLLPLADLGEALRCAGVRACGVATLGEACAASSGSAAPPFVRGPGGVPAGAAAVRRDGRDLADVIGQHAARRALEIAAAGEHNLLLCGPPGTGKSMLASRLSGILPPMSEHEAGEAAAIASISHAGFDESRWGLRPFRAPHHTVSGIALVGGGAFPEPMPGEASLAHNGVLFLDELTEFRRAVLDVLREPMETGRIAISRATRQADFPARFQLVAAMNPCPCGLHGEPGCACTPDRVRQYRSRLSAPFLERIDLHVDVRREELPCAALALLSPDDGAEDKRVEDSATVRARTSAARERQLHRQRCANARLPPSELGGACRLDDAGRDGLERAARGFGLSLRTVHRLLRVARTIADLDVSTRVRAAHLREALGYRERGIDPAPHIAPGGARSVQRLS